MLIDILCAALFVIIPCCCIWAYYKEKDKWNHGVSRYDGSQWVKFDIDSHGGRGYKDSSCNYIWISWPVDN